MYSPKSIRLATVLDTDSIGQLLYEFNTEYSQATPSPEKLSARFKMLLERDNTAVLLGGDTPDGLAVLRFRPSILSESEECYLAELYVRPDKRSQGLGYQLLSASIDLARSKGADYMDLGTSEADIAAIKLYESFGFTNREGRPDGPIMYVYEKEI